MNFAQYFTDRFYSQRYSLWTYDFTVQEVDILQFKIEEAELLDRMIDLYLYRGLVIIL